MPRRKVFEVSFFVDLHAVTSPGVWLCPKGKVCVRVTLFGVSEVTKLLPPVFPLLFHERFHFQKLFKKPGCLPLLEKKLGKLPISLHLLQYPEGTTATVKLANFRGFLGDLLFPPTGGDINLMFAPTKCYPGIIVPVAEVSTKLSLQESEIEDGTVVELPLTVFSKGTEGRKNDKGIVRQKSVCHTRHNMYCGCFANDAIGPKKKKFIIPSNKRKQSGEWVRRAMTPAHLKSHRNFNENVFEPTFEVSKDESSLDQIENGYVSQARHKNFKPLRGNQNVHQEDFGTHNCDSNSTSSLKPNHYNLEEKCSSYLNRGCHQKQLYAQNNETIKENYPRRRVPDQTYIYSQPCKFNEEEYDNLVTKNDRDINKLKQELKALLEEESQEKNVYKCSKQPLVCCPCCPKERYSGLLVQDGPGSRLCRAVRDVIPSSSEGFLATSNKEHCHNGESSLNSLEEDIQRRPLFYSNLHAAYQKLCHNRKHKKPVWR